MLVGTGKGDVLRGYRLPFRTDHRLVCAYTENQQYVKQKESSVNKFKFELHFNSDRLITDFYVL